MQMEAGGEKQEVTHALLHLPGFASSFWKPPRDERGGRNPATLQFLTSISDSNASARALTAEGRRHGNCARVCVSKGNDKQEVRAEKRKQKPLIHILFYQGLLSLCSSPSG